MTAEQIIAAAQTRRIAEGLALEVTGIPGRAGPFRCFARDHHEFNAWVAKYQAMGCEVNAILPSA